MDVAAAFRRALGEEGVGGNPDQRHPARNPRCGGGERNAAGAAHRARQPARRGRQRLQGPRATGDAGHAGRLRRDRAGARRLPARLRHPARAAGAAGGRAGGRRHTVAAATAAAHALDLLAGARRAGDRGAGREGPDRQQGRAPDHADLDSFALPRAAAVLARDRRVRAHRGRGRTRTPEGDHVGPGERLGPGLHRAHQCRRAERRSAGRGRRLPQARLGTDQAGERLDEGRPAGLRRPEPAAARDARPDVARSRQGARGFARDLRAAAVIRDAVHARFGRPGRTLLGRAPGLRPVRGRGRNPAGDAQGSAPEVGRAFDRRPDRGHDHHRREHRFLPRTAQPRRDRVPHQPGGGAVGGAATAPAQPGRHHHHRLHRHDRRRAQAPGVAHAREGPGARPRAHRGLRVLAAGPGGDDAQAHHRKPRTAVVRALPRMRRARFAEDLRDHCLRNLPRDHPRGAPVRSLATAGDRVASSGQQDHRRGIVLGGGAGGIPRQGHPLPGRRTIRAGTIRRGAARTS